jgi:hypothetical protein
MRTITDDDYTVARMVHAVNVVYQEIEDDVAPSSYRLENESPDKQASVVSGVRRLRMGMSLEQDHAAWCEDMTAMGFVHGEKKDPSAVPPTHPCLVPWDDLPESQKRKARMRLAIIREATLN